MKTSEIRQKYINYFKKNGHTYIQSSPLIPLNDPTLLFANAGMNQFKDFLTGKSVAPYKRAVTVQKCVRAGGKHNDLENVGFTSRHHTFFEMLGNFSFGDYFKEDAIKFAWEFLTKELKFPEDKLYVTVHYTDDEAIKIWNEVIGIPLSKIFKKDKDNFWEMGEFGPCGPSSEIFYDHGPNYATPNLKLGPNDDILADEMRYVEIWNLVFMQFEKRTDGTFPLPSPCIDTGAGLERLTAALQQKYWNYDIDSFSPIIKKIEELTEKKYSSKKYESSIRVIADHIRSATMLITDGVLPSNEGRGYVLRRIIRRAIRHLKDLGATEPTFYKLVGAVFESLGDIYPENKANRETAEKFLEIEEKKFLETLDLGLKYLEDAINKCKGNTLSGEMAFKLFDTYGLPLDLTELILKEKGFLVDTEEFNKCMEKQKNLSKKSWKGQDASGQKEIFYNLYDKWGGTEFLGYEKLSINTPLLAKEKVNYRGEDVYALVFPATPFYPESGGQMGDDGEILDSHNNKIATIFYTEKPVEDLIIHFCKDGDKLKLETEYVIKVNETKRRLTARNHTATHLLQQALIDVLGAHIKQAGSSVSSDRLRFDFTHPEKVSANDLIKVEEIVNSKISKSLNVKVAYLNKEDAIEKGAMALFGEKYGDVVRTIEIDNFSFELCGGTHVNNISEITLFNIISESALSSGVRRIEAITSTTALERLKNRSSLLKELEIEFSLPAENLKPHLTKITGDFKNLEKEISNLNWEKQQSKLKNLFDNPEKIKNDILFKGVVLSENDDLRKNSDEFISKNQNGIVLLLAEKKGKTSVLLRSSPNIKIDLVSLLNQSLKEINGKGGGRKDLAQGSGDVINNKEEFISKIRDLINLSL